MCLAIPGQIIEKQDDSAVIDMMGIERTASLALTPSAQVGDWVLIHAGFAIEVIDAEEAAQTIDIVRELGELAAEDLERNTAATNAVSTEAAS